MSSMLARLTARTGSGSTLSADEIIAHCKERIASYKKPRAVEFVASLPRNGMLLDRDELDRLFGGGGYVGLEPGA